MWDIIYLQNTWYFCLFSSVMYWRLLHNWNTFKKVYLQFLMYLQSFIKDKGLNFENGWKSIPSRVGIFKKILYVLYWVSIPNIFNPQKNPFSGRYIFLSIFLAIACFFLYIFGHLGIFDQIYQLYTARNVLKYSLFLKRKIFLTSWGVEFFDPQFEFL